MLVPKHVFPVFGSPRLDRIESGDVLTALSPIWVERPETARRVRQRIRTVLDWAKAKNFRTGENPVEGTIEAFAVGTALTGGPPHRSQRALLTHWAPTSGHDAQSLFGIRVQCSMLDDFHQPSVVDGIEESTDVRVEYPVLCQNSALLK